MALVVLLYKPTEHTVIAGCRFRVAVPSPEKEIAVAVNGGRFRSPWVIQYTHKRFIHFFTHWDFSDAALGFELFYVVPCSRTP